jgi:hypothetical protein
MWLSDTQLDELCEGISREQKARRCKFLRGLGLRVVETPSGAPRVLCSNVEAVLGGLPPADPKPADPKRPAASNDAQPGRAALVAHLSKGRRRVAA